MVKITRVEKSKLPEIDFNSIDFGKYISDHMFVSQYKNGQWSEGEVVPFGAIDISPAALALHYGQSVFEGMKAFKTTDGKVNVFRTNKHIERLNKSLDRMCMTALPEELFHNAIRTFIDVEKEWIPNAEQGSYYLRPFVFASESRYGVKVSEEFLFIIFGGPVGPYFPKPLNVKVETKYSRAAQGGTGAAKCAGNYGASFYPTRMAQKEGFDAIIWTDGSTHDYIEESGTMNLMFVKDSVIITPELTDSILPGITRDSLITMSKDLGIKVEERKVSVSEIAEGLENGSITEAFGTGTAAVVAPIQKISIHGGSYTLPSITEKSVQNILKNALHQLRTNGEKDAFGWNNFQ